MNELANKATLSQRDLTIPCEKLNSADTREKQVEYLTAMLAIYDGLLEFVNFYISNEESISNILDGREQAVKVYKQLTGQEYNPQQEDI